MFGKGLGRESFMGEDDIVFLNHGSYGRVPKPVFEHQITLKKEIEMNPDQFYRSTNPKLHRENLEKLCEFVGTSLENTVFVENLTQGMNTALRSLAEHTQGKVLITNFTYVKVLAQNSGMKVVTLDMDFPLTREKIIKSYRHCLEENDDIRVAIVDHITSPTSILMPLKEIALLCHQNGVQVVVDGAHSPGQISLQIEDFGVDIYIGNLHKWMFTPRGCGILWVSPALRPLVKPCVVSHFHGASLHFDHCVRGTRDDTPYHCVAKALQFIEEALGGMDETQKYVTALLDKSVENLLQSWSTNKLQINRDLQAPFMRLTRIPDSVRCPRTPKGAGYVEAYLYMEHRIRILCMLVDGDLFLRLSASVYNDGADFEVLDQAVLTMMALSEVPEHDPGYDLPTMHWDLRPLTIHYPEH